MGEPNNKPLTLQAYEPGAELHSGVIKEHCPDCDRIYLGARCRCHLSKRVRVPRCDCGEKAVEVLLDDLGEWPLCRRCLALSQAPAGQEPPAEAEQQVDATSSNPGGVVLEPPPLNLTRRQYQIAQMAHLSNHQIADRLSLSRDTVKTHISLILKKLGARSRHQIPGILAAALRKRRQQRERTGAIEARQANGMTVVFIPWESVDLLPAEIRDLLRRTQADAPQLPPERKTE